MEATPKDGRYIDELRRLEEENERLREGLIVALQKLACYDYGIADEFEPITRRNEALRALEGEL